LENLRYSFFIGDALYHSETVLWKSCLPNAVIHNFYGPTEATIYCTRYEWMMEISEKESLNDIVPLGKSFPKMISMIVDDNNREVEPGNTGELAFAGVQVIDQYLGGKYEDKFFFDQAGVRFYKTGDLASLNNHGHLIFHGRTDCQVKINGYRIELPEIEDALSRVVNRKVVVLKVTPVNHIPFLRAFIEGEAIDLAFLNEALKDRIPSYMIPADYCFVNQIPLNQNGKIDKQQLYKIVL
jgi:acyl-coenzyme A synthetase/AMP-(fatty) acid ligase